MNNYEWLQQRRTAICGTDIAAILGFSPWRGAYQVWYDKVVGDEYTEENESMYWGTKLEPVVFDEYVNRTGYDVRKGEFTRHKDIQYFAGTPDGLIFENDSVSFGLEIKTASTYTRDEWGRGSNFKPPTHYYIQAAWYMHIFDCESWDFAVLFGGNEYKQIKVNRNIKTEDVLVDTAHKFWNNHVITKEAPGMDSSEWCKKYIDKKFSEKNKFTIDADSETDKIIQDLIVAKEDAKKAKQREQELQNKLKFAMGENSGINGAAATVTYKPDKNGKRSFNIRKK